MSLVLFHSLFAGIWGTLLLVWTNPDAKLAVQAIGVVSYGVLHYCKLHCLVHYQSHNCIRASKDDEEYGLDMSELGTVSFPDFTKIITSHKKRV